MKYYGDPVQNDIQTQPSSCRNGTWNCKKDFIIADICNITDFRLTGRFDVNYIRTNNIDVYSKGSPTKQTFNKTHWYNEEAASSLGFYSNPYLKLRSPARLTEDSYTNTYAPNTYLWKKSYAPYVPQMQGYDLAYLMKYAYRYNSEVSKGTRYYYDRNTYSTYKTVGGKKVRGKFMKDQLTFVTGYYKVNRYI